MTKKRGTKRALLMSFLSLVLCASMLIGSTFAWFTDSVTSAGNKIQAGTLKLDLELLQKKEDGTTAWTSIKEDETALFDYDKWEPGYTEVKVLKVENEGNLALKWYAKFISADEVSILAEAIDVYVCPSETELAYPANRNLEGYTKVGTLDQFIDTIESSTYGNLGAGEKAYLGIALKMQEEAGNVYQGEALGAFDIMILATQDTVEVDSFDNTYDANAEYEEVEMPAKNVTVTTAEELKEALSNVTEEVVIDATGVSVDIATADMLYISGGVTLKGATINAKYRGGNYVAYAAGVSDTVVLEDCVIGNSDRSVVLAGTTDGPVSVIYNNCTFKGQIITNFVDNADGVAEFNNCLFTATESSYYSFTEAMGGTHNFNACTFDYTGKKQDNMGVINNASLNVYSEPEYSTTVVLTGCTRTACGTRTYGPNSSLIYK